MDRRRFLFLFGGSTAAIALAGQGAIAMPHRMAMLASGRCSFCLGASGLRSLAGMLGKPARICDLCVTFLEAVASGEVPVSRQPMVITSTDLITDDGTRKIADFLSASARDGWDAAALRSHLGSLEPPVLQVQLAEGVAEAIASSPSEIRVRLRAADLLSHARAIDAAAAQYSLVANSYRHEGFYLKSLAMYKQVEKIHPSPGPVLRHEMADVYDFLGLQSDAVAMRERAGAPRRMDCSFCDAGEHADVSFPVLGDRVCEPCVREAATLFEKYRA